MDLVRDNMIQKVLGFIAIGITIYAFFPYVREIHRGKVRPHLFSWVIWGSTTLVVGIAQFLEKGGAGSWSIMLSGALTFYVVYLAYIHKSDTSITVSDKIVFVISMSAIPVWIITSNPLWAVVILTSVDVAGYYPTYRKTYHDPYSEKLILYFIMTTRNIMSSFAMETYSMTTLLFPIATCVANMTLVFMAIYLRRIR